jgi:hypothetical protein
MKTKSTIRLAYRNFLRAGFDMRDAIKAELVRGKLPARIVAELADEHAECYECHAYQTESGAWRFSNDAEDTTSANRHEAATRQWNRAIVPFTGQVKSKQGGARYKTEKELMTHRDFVLKAFNLLSAKDRAWVIANAK